MTVMLFGVAVPLIELVLGVVMLFVILGMAGFSTWLFFWGGDWLEDLAQRRAFPVVVPGWKTRMAELPPFESTAEDVGRMNSLMLKHAVAAGYKAKDVKQKLNNGLIRWVKADPSLDGKRAVVDPYGRRVQVKNDRGEVVYEKGKPKTKPMLVAGWHSGDHIFVVFVPEDVLEKTAYAHEQGHEVHELKGLVDYAHKDVEMWGGKDNEGNRVEGIVTLAKNEMHKERTGEDPVDPLDNGIEVSAG